MKIKMVILAIILSILLILPATSYKADIVDTSYVKGESNEIETAIINDGNTLYVGGRDTIFVYSYSSPYHENLVINKSVNLIGEDRNTTIIDGGGTGTVIVVVADLATIAGFTLQNGGSNWSDSGVEIRSDYNHVLGTIIQHNCFGIFLNHSDHNTVSGNRVVSNWGHGILSQHSKTNMLCNNYILSSGLHGLVVYYSSHHNLSCNHIMQNGWTGIYICHSRRNQVFANHVINNSRGMLIGFSGSTNNVIDGNHINSNQGDGICLQFSAHYNLISNNDIAGNTGMGVHLRNQSYENRISRNNFIENGCNAYFNNSFCNHWRRNYWDDWSFLPLPKPIYGEIKLCEMEQWSGWVNLDLNPAKEPYGWWKE